jgi:cytochrome bd ubiquinol oxidase subunit I
MDALILSRIQFGISIGFHYIYPIVTLGLTFFIVIFETLYLFRKREVDRSISGFLINILGVTFALGVATGIMMPFAIGAHWTRFSVFAGGVLGSQLLIESISAFALESVFLAILLFGRSKAGARLFWFSACMVFLGSHLSGFWIVSANSWMQTPSGFALENGRVVLTSLYDAILNPSAVIRFIHVTSAAWLTGAVLVSGIGAYYLLKNKFTDFGKRLITVALIPFILCALTQAGLGHAHIMQVKEHAPAKNAAYEGMFTSTNGAILYMFGIPDSKNKVIRFGIGIPKALSFLETGDFNSHVEGLDKFPESEWPPVNIIFTTFHLMVMIGVLLIVTSLFAGLLFVRRRLFESRKILTLLFLIIPLPFIANELGWMGTEIGRQPWIIQGLMKTADANAQNIPASSLLSSIIITSILYIFLLAIYIITVRKMVKTGPSAAGKEANHG